MSGDIFIETVRARSFGLPVSEHLYLVFRDTNGDEFVLRGGPTSPVWPFGELAVEVNVPIEDSADSRDGDSPEDRASTPLDFGIGDDGAWAIMVKYARLIEAADYAYQLVTENSNAFVGALLHAAGGTPEGMLPVGIDPEDAIGFSSWDDIVRDIAPPEDGIFRGTGGDDLIVGLQIDEVIRAGAGDDIVEAGRGDDDVRGGDGRDALRGEVGDDLLFGENGDDDLHGGDGDDRLDGGAGDDLLDGGAGVDRAAFAGSAAVTASLRLDGAQDTGDGRDTLRDIEDLMGGTGDDDLTGDHGANALVGRGGDDRLRGGAGDDRLVGGAGRDELNGGFGDDLMIGGGGSDRFVFANCVAGEVDTVADYLPGVDRLVFAGIADPSDAQISDAGAYAELEWDGYRLRLDGVDATALSVDAFDFV